MTVTLLGILAMYGLVLTRSRDDASILTSSIASFYCLYLQWSALSSSTDIEANPTWGKTGTDVLQIVLGCFFTVTSLFVISASTKTKDDTNLTAEAGGHLMEKEADLEERPESEKPKSKAEEEHVFAISSATILF